MVDWFFNWIFKASSILFLFTHWLIFFFNYYHSSDIRIPFRANILALILLWCKENIKLPSLSSSRLAVNIILPQKRGRASGKSIFEYLSRVWFFRISFSRMHHTLAALCVIQYYLWKWLKRAQTHLAYISRTISKLIRRVICPPCILRNHACTHRTTSSPPPQCSGIHWTII